MVIIFICRLGAGIPAPQNPLPCEERVRMESETGLEQIVAGLRAPQAVSITAGVAIVRGDEVVQFDHFLSTVADVVVLRGIVSVDALLIGLIPVAGEELSGDADFFCGGLGV